LMLIVDVDRGVSAPQVWVHHLRVESSVHADVSMRTPCAVQKVLPTQSEV